MQRISNKSIVPPNGWRFTVRETGFTVKANDHWSWIQKTKAHLRANEIAVPSDLEAQMHAQICGQIPPEYCDRPNESWVNTRFGWGEFMDGMKAFGRLLAGGFQFVDKVEAERRAYLCAGCPLNVNLSGCGTCRRMATFLTGDVAKQKTAYDADLRACAICKCSLAAKVHFRLEDIEEVEAEGLQSQYPDFCWLKRGGENYRRATDTVASTGQAAMA